MRSKLKVQLPQVLSKTQASYQHHMLDMISQLVKQQKQNNYLLKAVVKQESVSLTPLVKKLQYGSVHENHRQMFSEDSYLSETQQKQSFDQLSRFRNQSNPQCYTLQDKYQLDHNKQNFSEVRSFNNSPRIHKHQLEQPNIIMPISAMQSLIRSIGNLEKSINSLDNKIETQNKLLQNSMDVQNKIKTIQKQRSQSIYLQHQKNFDEIVKQLRKINQTIKEKPQNLGNLIRISQQSNGFKVNHINKEQQNFAKQQNDQSQKLLAQEVMTAIEKQQKKKRRSRLSKMFDQPVMLQTNSLDQVAGLDTETRNFKSIKQYSRLSQIQPHCDKRQIKVRVSFYEMFVNSEIAKVENKKQFELYITQWLGVSYRATASICWNMLQSRQLSFEEVKILFTQNIIFNFIQLMKDVRNLGFKEQVNLVPQIVNKKSINILEFLCHQYPQTKIEAPNMALRTVVPQINEQGRFQYELVSSSGVQFTLKKTINYSSQIMQFINYLIDVSNKQYNYFEEYMLKLFSQLYVPVQMRGTQATKNISNNQVLSAYQEKVKRYTKFVIGRKISENTPKYTKQEIQIGIFFIKSAKVLRVIAKWAEDLINIIENPDTAIRDWFYPFKSHNGTQQHALYAIRKGIYKTILSTRSQIFEKLDSIRKQCYKIEGELAKAQHISDQDEVFLSQQQTNVGLFASNVKNALSSFLWEQLSHVIHFLLRAPLRTDQKTLGLDQFLQASARTQLDSINLVTFRIFDLLRCKCVSGESQIIWLVNEFRKLQKATSQLEDNQKFTIVRFKDRLSKGTRDILVNAKIGTGPVCQIQLSISNQVEQKQQMLDKYNHFLYELKRAALLGPLIENVSIWSSSEQKSSYFDQLTERKFSRGVVVPENHKCPKVIMEQYVQPMVCSSCHTFFHIPRTCLQNWHCKTCKVKYCGQCFVVGMNAVQRKKSIFSNKMPKQFLSMIEQYQYSADKQIPKYAFFFKKNFLKPELSFMTTYKVNQQQENLSKTKAAETVLRDGKILNRTLIKNEYEMDKMSNFLMFKFIQPQILQDLTVEQIRLLDFENDNKLKFTSLMFQPNYLKNITNISSPKRKEKLLKTIQDIIGDRKITILKIKKQIILIKVALECQELQKQLTIKDNLQRLRSFAEANSSVISIEKKNISVQMQLIQEKIGTSMYQNMCARVQKIYLNYGTMKEIQAIRPLYRLRSLYFSNNQVKSLAGIEDLSRLRNINFDKNEIDSLENFKSLKKVEKIMGGDNLINSLQGIQNLSNLKELSLNGNQIEKIQFLENAHKLQLLYLYKNKISKIENMDSLVSLKKLNISSNPIRNVQNIKGLVNLRELYLTQLMLSQIPYQIQFLAELVQLYLDNNEIQKIDNLKGLLKLKTLSLTNNRIQTIQNIGNLQIQKLFLDQNRITKINCLKDIVDTIEVFSILKNRIEDVSQLVGLIIQFKFFWSKNLFTPEARNKLQRIFKRDPTLIAQQSCKNISEYSGNRSEGENKEDENNQGDDQ